MSTESKLNFIFKSTNLHGFKLLADGSSVAWKKGFIRLFWTVAFTLSFYFMSKMLRNVFRKAGQSTAIMPDTSYLHWINAFPAFSLCMHKGQRTGAVKEFLNANIPKDQINDYAMRHYRLMQSILFLNVGDPMQGMTLEHCEKNDTCGIDIAYAKRVLIPLDCNKIIKKLIVFGKKIRCEKVFKYYETEYGSCFIANSIYSSRNLEDFNLGYSALPLVYKNTDQVERAMEIHYQENDFLLYKFSVHSPDDMPDGNTTFFGLRKAGLRYYIALKTVEFINDPDVPFESQESRQCRFPSEKFDNFSLPYCRANCFYLKRVERELAECGCTLPAGLNTGLNTAEGVPKCSIKKVECVAEALKRYNEGLKDKETAKKSIEGCLIPTCTFMEVTKVGEYEEAIEGLEKGHGVIKVEVMNKPTLRYVRRVQFTTLDLIVQVGGIIGLFFGASFLSIIEIFYLVFQIICMKRHHN